MDTKQLVILEGCDKTGKSTLASLLSVKLDNALITHNVQPVPGEDTLDRYTSQLNPGFLSHIIDRWAFSELVYGKIYRNGTAFNEPQLLNLLKAVPANAKFIMLDAPIVVVHQRFLEENEDFTSLDDIMSIKENFFKLMTYYLMLTNHNFLYIDSSKKSPEEIAMEVLNDKSFEME